MYVHTPGIQTRAPDPGNRALQLAMAMQRTGIPRGSFSSHDYDYFTDLFAQYGLGLDQQQFDCGRTTFTDLVDALLPDLAAYRDRFDLALMASAGSDAEPGWPMCFLSHVVPEAGLAFAVSDQGIVGAFTALLLADNRARLGAIRIVLFVLDQANVLHTRPVPEYLRIAEDAAAVLVFDAVAGTAPLDVAEPQPVAPECAGGQWRALFEAEKAAAELPFTAVIGAGLVGVCGDQALPLEVVPVAAGRPSSGIWAVVAARLPRWQASGRRVLLADYDRELGRLAHCVLTVEPGSGGGEQL
jgi:hypothetical protein